MLGYRELGFGLEDIVRLLDDPDVDPSEHLRRQHALLVEQAARLTAIAAAVHRTLEARTMGIELTPAQIREVFGDADPTEHAAEARERWGDTDAYRQSQQRTSAYGKADWQRQQAEQADLERRLAKALQAGEPASWPRARALAEEHRLGIERFYDCSYEMHVGLAEMYLADERFRQHYEAVAPGLAQYVHDAVRANAASRA